MSELLPGKQGKGRFRSSRRCPGPCFLPADGDFLRKMPQPAGCDPQHPKTAARQAGEVLPW